jgi:predicted O-methyltransferase YrrM
MRAETRRVPWRAACLLAWPLLAACAAGPVPAPRAERAALADAVLRELEVKDKDILNVVREEGRFLNLLVRMTGATRVLEIGSSNGYASIWMALALEETGGRLTAVDIDPDRVKRARESLRRCGLDARVTCIEGDAHEVVRTLAGPFDFILLDADKRGQMDYFNVLFPKLLPGGILLCHNAVAYRDRMEDYLEAVMRHPELDTVLMGATLKDAFAVSRRKVK